jgi:hypothetical protein
MPQFYRPALTRRDSRSEDSSNGLLAEQAQPAGNIRAGTVFIGAVAFL